MVGWDYSNRHPLKRLSVPLSVGWIHARAQDVQQMRPISMIEVNMPSGSVKAAVLIVNIDII